MSDQQFHIFHNGHNLSSDQLAVVAEDVSKRRRLLKAALDNLSRIMDNTEPDQKPAFKSKPKPVRKPPQVNKPASGQLVKTDTSTVEIADQEALKGRVSYKVKDSNGRPMNIAEIKAKINSIYEGKPGIIKQ